MNAPNNSASSASLPTSTKVTKSLAFRRRTLWLCKNSNSKVAIYSYLQAGIYSCCQSSCWSTNRRWRVKDKLLRSKSSIYLTSSPSCSRSSPNSRYKFSTHDLRRFQTILRLSKIHSQKCEGKYRRWMNSERIFYRWRKMGEVNRQSRSYL